MLIFIPKYTKYLHVSIPALIQNSSIFIASKEMSALKGILNQAKTKPLQSATA
jgi:hypothetical protein